jgi:hypothetical protein
MFVFPREAVSLGLTSGMSSSEGILVPSTCVVEYNRAVMVMQSANRLSWALRSLSCSSGCHHADRKEPLQDTGHTVRQTDTGPAVFPVPGAALPSPAPGSISHFLPTSFKWHDNMHLGRTNQHGNPALEFVAWARAQIYIAFLELHLKISIGDRSQHRRGQHSERQRRMSSLIRGRQMKAVTVILKIFKSAYI